jgi:predicted RNA-binding protein with RPS1 domain
VPQPSPTLESVSIWSMRMFSFGALLIAIACLAVAFGFNPAATLLSRTAFQRWGKIQSVPAQITQMVPRPFALKMATVEETTTAVEESAEAAPAAPAAPADKDFSSYVLGKEYEGKALSAKAFGIFVDIGTATNVLVPRSALSRNGYEKLKLLVDNKSEDTVKVEITNINAANQTLSGKYIFEAFKRERNDLSTLAGLDVTGKFFAATVVSAHDFGVFAKVDEYGVEGLIPLSRLPEVPAGSTLKDTYT